MADPLAPSASERLKGFLGTAVLLTFVGAGLWFAVTLLTSEEQQIVHEKMTVIGFGMGASYAGNSAIVRVRDESGNEYQVAADANIGERCARGDSIDIQRQGINLQLGVGGCTRPNGSA